MIKTIRPTSDGNHTDFSPLFGIVHYVEVDEVIADDATTSNVGMLGADDWILIDSYGVEDIQATHVEQVKVFIRVKGEVYPTPHDYRAKILCRTHDNDYYSDVKTLDGYGDTWENFDFTWTVNPNTSLPWTEDEVNAMEIGITIAGDASWFVEITQAYAEVSCVYSRMPTFRPVGS